MSRPSTSARSWKTASARERSKRGSETTIMKRAKRVTRVKKGKNKR